MENKLKPEQCSMAKDAIEDAIENRKIAGHPSDLGLSYAIKCIEQVENTPLVEPFYIPDFWKKFIAGDYGHKKPSSIGWYAISPEGKVFRYREIYQEGLSKPFLCKCRSKDAGAMTVKVVNDDFLQCPRCSGLFVRTTPTESEIESYIEDWYLENCPVPKPYSQFFKEIAKAITYLINPQPSN